MRISPLGWLRDQLAPRRCPFCGVALERSERPVCDGCYCDLPWLPQPTDTQRLHPNPFTAVVTPLEYDFPVDVAIKAFKFRRKLHYQPAFAEILLRSVPMLPDDVDALLPVPLHRHRRLVRRFNQAEELARPLRSALAVNIVRGMRRVRHTAFQSGLSEAARRRNLKSAFRLRGVLQARHVLIVDDVITTGETCRQVARVLLNNNVKKVSVLALARATAAD